MTPEEQNLIEGLFQRLRQADATPKDAQAEQLIRAKTAELPSATYLLVQAVLVQEHALANAQARITELESRIQTTQPSPGSGSFLSRFFGTKPQSQPAPPPLPQQVPATQQVQAAPPPISVVPQNTPYPSTVNLGPSSGGSFLQSAMATAAGVAGGQLLFQGIESLIGRNAGPFGPALESRGGFYPSGTERGTEIVNNYYNTEPTGNAEQHHQVQSDNFSQGVGEPVPNTEPTKELVSDTDYADGGAGAQDLDLAGSDDSAFSPDDSFSGSDDSLV
jgi:hypothetical protein